MSKYDAYSFGLRNAETPDDVQTVFRCITEDWIGVSNREWSMIREMAANISDTIRLGLRVSPLARSKCWRRCIPQLLKIRKELEIEENHKAS